MNKELYPYMYFSIVNPICILLKFPTFAYFFKRRGNDPKTRDPISLLLHAGTYLESRLHAITWRRLYTLVGLKEAITKFRQQTSL